MAGGERIRLFCALRLPGDVLDAVVAWQLAHLRGGRIVPRENLHVTLAFLGSRPESDLPRVVDALRAAAGDAGLPLLAVHGYRETRSVGMLTLDDRDGRASALAERLFDGLEAAGVYRRETRPWFPHLTVLRFRDRPRLRPPLPGIDPFAASDAAAYLSRLHPHGARYEVLESVPLSF